MFAALGASIVAPRCNHAGNLMPAAAALSPRTPLSWPTKVQPPASAPKSLCSHRQPGACLKALIHTPANRFFHCPRLCSLFHCCPPAAPRPSRPEWSGTCKQCHLCYAPLSPFFHHGSGAFWHQSPPCSQHACVYTIRSSSAIVSHIEHWLNRCNVLNAARQGAKTGAHTHAAIELLRLRLSQSQSESARARKGRPFRA